MGGFFMVMILPWYPRLNKNIPKKFQTYFQTDEFTALYYLSWEF